MYFSLMTNIEFDFTFQHPNKLKYSQGVRQLMLLMIISNSRHVVDDNSNNGDKLNVGISEIMVLSLSRVSYSYDRQYVEK